MSLETTIASLVAAANALTAAVTGKMSEIDAKVTQATASVPAAVRAEVVKTLWVDSSNGSDANAGTASTAPLKTVKAALDKTITGGVSTIYLRRGLVYELGGEVAQQNQVGGKSIAFLPYGTETARPILRGVLGVWSGSVYACSAFRASTRVTLKFSDIRIETGLANGKTQYGADYGGLITRAGGDGESVNFEVYFHKCDIQIQDVPLFTCYYGFMSLSFANSTVTKGGTQAKIVSSDLPKLVDITSVGISGFGSGSTVDSLFSLNSGGYISRQANSTVSA